MLSTSSYPLDSIRFDGRICRNGRRGIAGMTAVERVGSRFRGGIAVVYSSSWTKRAFVVLLFVISVELVKVALG